MNKLFLFVIGFVVCSYSYAENDKAFAWQVTTSEATVYLIGSMHYADKSFYPLRKEIEDAFNRSEYLVVELDINNIDHDLYMQILSQDGLYKDDKTIKEVVSDETWLQLRRHVKRLNINYETIKKYKPGLLVLTLTATQITQMGFDAALGVDAYFLNRAVERAHVKKIIALETLQQQLKLFLEMPDGELLLKESLRSLGEAEPLMLAMVDLWKRGDVKQMNKLLFEDALHEYPAFSEIYDRIFYQRNKVMVSKLDDMLKNKSASRVNYFVVVGSGHLVGDKGIVNALKEKGYKVKRM